MSNINLYITVHDIDRDSSRVYTDSVCINIDVEDELENILEEIRESLTQCDMLDSRFLKSDIEFEVSFNEGVSDELKNEIIDYLAFI